LLRTLQDMTVTTEDEAIRAQLLERGRRVLVGCRGRLDDTALARLSERLDRLAEMSQACAER
jgi:hypothetical protein